MADTFNVDQFREDLLSRNLYSVDKPYPAELNTKQKIANSVNSVMNWVAPFKGYDLTNTVYGRLLITPNTPIAKIGLHMLGVHLMYQVKSNLSREYLPTINPLGALKGGKLIEFKEDFSITKLNDSRWYMKVLDRVSGAVGVYSPKLINLTNGGGNSELMDNTGKGQLTKLFEHINLNELFKPYSSEYQRNAERIGFKLKHSGGVFSNVDGGFIGYGGELTFDSMKFVNTTTGWVRNTTINDFSAEYLGVVEQNIDFVDYDEGNVNKWVDGEVLDGGINPRKSLVWGVSENYNENNIKHGVLKNTLDLMVGSDGRLIDQTKEVVSFQGSKPGFNGSALVNRTFGEIGKKHERQHTVNNQYNRLAKAIRSNGCKLYDDIFLGAKDSVIYDSVIPRVHPTRDDEGNLNIENLMFSIENLAVETKDSGYGYGWLDDGTHIPLSEVGVGGGRMIWFAPYDVRFNETTNNRIESTVMMGRNEPMYNYQSSERSGTISFKLIIDHPPHVRSISKREGGNPLHRDYAEFFAFGGDYEYNEDIPEPEPPEEEQVVPPPPPPPLPTEPSKIKLFFANDQPKTNNINTVFDYLYSVGYEVRSDVKPGRDENGNLYDGTARSFGLNNGNFVAIGETCLLPISNSNIFQFTVDKNCFENSGFSQYDVEFPTEKFESFFNFYSSDIDLATKYFKIIITSSATKHHRNQDIQSQYNLELSKRRTEAAEKFIKDRLLALFPGDKNLINNIEFELNWTGSKDSGVTDNNVDSGQAKEERVAVVEVKRNSLVYPDPEEVEPVPEPEPPPIRIPEPEFLYKHRGDEEDNGVLPGFSSISGGYFYPTFHSQTPEEFHRRLTFLQQCSRQGTSIRYDSDSDGNMTIKNSVFGKQPICVLRYGDFIHSKVIIENLNIDYDDAPLDFNPEGFGVQPMFADVTLQVKFIGGQSLRTPIDALQNAISFNYYANSSYSNKGMYKKAYETSEKQRRFNDDVVEQMRNRSSWNNFD